MHEESVYISHTQPVESSKVASISIPLYFTFGC